MLNALSILFLEKMLRSGTLLSINLGAEKQRRDRQLSFGTGLVETPPQPLKMGSMFLIGGPWDLVITYNWDYNPTYNWGNPYKPILGDYK